MQRLLVRGKCVILTRTPQRNREIAVSHGLQVSGKRNLRGLLRGSFLNTATRWFAARNLTPSRPHPPGRERHRELLWLSAPRRAALQPPPLGAQQPAPAERQLPGERCCTAKLQSMSLRPPGI